MYKSTSSREITTRAFPTSSELAAWIDLHTSLNPKIKYLNPTIVTFFESNGYKNESQSASFQCQLLVKTFTD